jgi:ABC-type multidrug transport system ATPase subunit
LSLAIVRSAWKGLSGRKRLHPSRAADVLVDMTKSSHRKPRGQLRPPGTQVVEVAASSALDELVGIAGGRIADARPVTEAIVLEGLTKTYPDGTEAVRGISLRVAAGECFGILGPNGAGKSTTIGMLGTLVKPTGGHARVGGFDVAAEPVEVRRRIGFAMQQAGVDEFATASELVVLQGRLQGLAKREATTRARLLLRAMELEQVADTRLAALSGGTKRRVDLAASLVHLPPVLFLDEPTEGLDPRSRTGIWDTLDRLRRDLGVTVVLSTHYMDEGDRLCDRIAIIDRGSVVVEGAPATLKARVGGDATMEDVYLHYTGRELEPTAVAA